MNEIKSGTNPKATQPNWDLAANLAGRFPVDAARLKRTVFEKNIADMDAIVAELEQRVAASSHKPVVGQGIDKGTLDAALRAFKKRLKVSRLADESKLGGRYTSGGRQSNIDAIQPPSEFGPEVWKALEAEGRLKHTGQGFYAEP